MFIHIVVVNENDELLVTDRAVLSELETMNSIQIILFITTKKAY